jgi:ATP-dependent exoDNAse (exonuclease V) alpha subunit
MIPLELGWAISAHKAQGMTVPFATFDLGSYELDAGVTFVASSRARCANNVALKCEDLNNYAYDRWELLRTPGYRKNLASKFERRVRFQAKLNELEEDTLASWLTNHAHAATFRKWLAEDPPPPTFLPAEAPGANL